MNILADFLVDSMTALSQQGPLVALLIAIVIYMEKRNRENEAKNKEMETRWNTNSENQMKSLMTEIEAWKGHTEECDNERQDLRHDLQKLMEWVMQLHVKGDITSVPEFRTLHLSLEDNHITRRAKT